MYKKGKIEPKDLKPLFTELEISDNGLDFISQCLHFDPDKRITVDEALEHDFVKLIRDRTEEVNSEKISRFDFLFEDQDIEDIDELRQLILEETMLYHDPSFCKKYLEDKKNYNEFVMETTKLINNSSLVKIKDKGKSLSLFN